MTTLTMGFCLVQQRPKPHSILLSSLVHFFYFASKIKKSEQVKKSEQMKKVI